LPAEDRAAQPPIVPPFISNAPNKAGGLTTYAPLGIKVVNRGRRAFSKGG
jgi:hypothetical protein